jgi:hypothetical protein
MRNMSQLLRAPSSLAPADWILPEPEGPPMQLSRANHKREDR